MDLQAMIAYQAVTVGTIAQLCNKETLLKHLKDILLTSKLLFMNFKLVHHHDDPSDNLFGQQSHKILSKFLWTTKIKDISSR
uniref:Uncharacterized protein n=1 Tax=Acrobeloides nanus TaxID=290746 RepID=A0A914DV09_9BILA